MKIGILTHYYKSVNYGGNLQAYALCEFLNSIDGIHAEQICYDMASYQSKGKLKKNRVPFTRRVCLYLKRTVEYINFKRRNLQEYNKWAERNSNFELFSKSIPHSCKVIKSDDYNKIKGDYDVLIVGSDQVWHPNYLSDVFLLNFDFNIIKISYAASMSQGSIPIELQERLKSSLGLFDAISVREISLQKELAKLGIKSALVLDPTLLLEPSRWEHEVKCPISKTNYIFCYFLSNNKKERELVREFADKKGLKIVAIGYLNGMITKKDNAYFDESCTEAGPREFLSLIKNASYIFTDSFHAVVFSLIFKKNFFVFNRAGENAMGTRIESILSLFNMTERFCDSKEKLTLNYIDSLHSIDYNKDFPKFEAMKVESIKFIEDNLIKAKERLNEVDRI